MHSALMKVKTSNLKPASCQQSIGHYKSVFAVLTEDENGD